MHTEASTPRTTGSASPAVIHPAVKTFPAGENPHDLAVAGGKLWVADFGGPVREYDARGHQVKTIALDAQSMAPGPGSVWVGLLSNSNTGPQGPIAEIEAHGGHVARRVKMRDSADVLAVGHGAVWAASRFATRVTRIPLSGGPQRTFKVPGAPTAIAVGPGGVWVAYGAAKPGLSAAVGEPQTGEGGVVKLDPKSGRQLAKQSKGAVPTALVVAHGTVWVALADDVNQVDRIDEATGQSGSGEPIAVGQEPTGLVAGDGSVWVLNYADGTVTRVDPASGHTVATIAFGARTDPSRLAANSPIRLAVTLGTLWVTDAEANTLRRLPDR
jgi:streptogramin lyase